jgi:hypothetical protein
MSTDCTSCTNRTFRTLLTFCLAVAGASLLAQGQPPAASRTGCRGRARAGNRYLRLLDTDDE